MNEYLFLFAIAGVLLVGAMSPGPSFLIVAQSALSKSRAHGLATAFGTALGVSIFAVLASFGVTTLIENVPDAFIAFKIAGGLYILYLACNIWRGAREPLAQSVNTGDAPSMRASSMFHSFLTGLATQLSNPKTALVIAGIFAAFVPENAPAYTTILVAIIAFAIDFGWYAVVALALSSVRSRDAYSRAKTGFDRIAAVFLGFVGVKLFTISLDSS